MRLVLVRGLPGSSKSTLAQALNPATGWTLLRSDMVRKELAGQDMIASYATAPIARAMTVSFGPGWRRQPSTPPDPPARPS